ncbi:MAG: hypothetical protein JNJ73_17385 [Hyphomonadaceae bacterium]|nr:hypothetical protein [Hyphomonadaceae bacterium]
MRRLKVLLAGAGLLALAACVTTTAYAPATRPGGYGYSEQQIEANRARVTFRGNGSTPRETVENLLLYRAAELTLANGFDHFIVADRDTDKRTRMQAYGGSRAFYPAFYPYWSYYSPRWGWRPWSDPFWDDPVSYREVTQFEASAEIAMARGPKPADNPRAYDAREVQANLRNLATPPPPPAG